VLELEADAGSGCELAAACLQQRQTERGRADLARHVERIACARTRARERRGRGVADHGRGDRQLAAGREIAASDDARERALRLSDAVGDCIEVVLRQSLGGDHRHERGPRRRAHRGQVAQCRRERAVADVGRCEQIVTKVHALDLRVDTHRLRARARCEHGRVVADAEQHVGAGERQPPADLLDALELVTHVAETMSHARHARAACALRQSRSGGICGSVT
jgi:hypothetical protein